MSLKPPLGQIESVLRASTVSQALLAVSLAGRIQFATVRANLWIRYFFPGDCLHDCLPTTLARWLDHEISAGQSSQFITERLEKSLCIRLLCREATSVCLLLEHHASISAKSNRDRALTKRQTEVLSWVACGKTNAEIGEILSLKTGTVGKYLERIFPKLGVENRTTAASFVLGANRR